MGLGNGSPAVKLDAQLPDRASAQRITPLCGNLGGRFQYKATFGEFGMRNAKASASPKAARPKDDVQIKHPRGPALTAPSPPEIALQLFELDEQVWRRQACFNQRRRIGVAALRRAERAAGDAA